MSKKKSLAESLDNINSIINREKDDVHIDPDHLGDFAEETAYLKERMGLEPFQSILFAVIVQMDPCACNLRNIGEAIGASYLQTLSYSKDFNALRNNGLIKVSRRNNIAVPDAVIDALMKDEPYSSNVSGLNDKKLMLRIRKVMDLLYEDDIQQEEAMDEILSLVKANPDTAIAKGYSKYIESSDVTRDVILIFFIICHLYANKGMQTFPITCISLFFPHERYERVKSCSLQLISAGVLCEPESDGFDTDLFMFKEELAKELFPGIDNPEEEERTIDLVDGKTKAEKKLFYNAMDKQQVERLENLLYTENLVKVYDRMAANGFKKGFTCLFYGAPGTGKTETVYQLARKSGRKILPVSIDQIRDKYVGETEKRMKAVFERYRIAISEEKGLAPILLLNEADAIIGRRNERAEDSVDRMENAMQNILLQEMEDFEGIMIATTNLPSSFDPAFERRFLYKIQFHKPGKETRALIWKSKLPSLSKEEVCQIAGEFEFSGGQIDNIVKKYNIDSILSGDVSFEQIHQYCLEESISKKARRRIGYNIAG